MADFAPPAEQATAPLTPGSDPMDAEPHIPVPKLSDMASLVPQLANCETEAEFVYRWSITDWKEKKRTNKVYSPTFEFNGAQWRILVFPNGNNGGDTLAVFLDSVTAAEQPKDSNWHMCLSFAIAVSNPDDDDVFKHMSANHRYNPHELDWGFNHLVKLNALALPLEGQTKSFLVDDERLVISVHMRAIKDETGILWHNFQHYDSKKVTGFVGLKNQGATCYMNSLLQSLYFINYFRKATFNIPTENDEPTKSIPLALQRVFYQLQFSDQSVGTIELTKSFGWDTLDSFMQHDVQEFNRVLQDNLESKMKGTKAEGAISRLFVGKYKSYIKCINVNFESSRIEDFYDIQLNVKGFKTLHDSFVDYIAVETMDGDNQYRAEGHGLQDAKKGVIFTEFPPVLHLQLKRFEYDMEKDAMVKINDRYEFPNEIDLAPFLDPSSPQKGPQKYLLHGVLVHAGDLTGGHYCAFLRSEKNGKWFKFDDDRVTPVTDKDATEENFGVDSNTKTKLIKRFTNAYMLVYVRENASDEILKPIETEDIPEHLRQRFEEERLATEQKRRDREEQHLFSNIKYVTDADAQRHSGFDLCNLDDKALPLSEIKSLKIRKEEKFGALREQLAITLNTPVERVKIWSMVHRQNKTVRVDTLITSDEKTVEQVRESLKITSELRLYIDTESIAPSDSNSILIFIKRYDPLSGTIRVAGKCFFSRTQKLQDVIPDIVDIAGIQGPNIKVFEEVKPTMIDEVDLSKTFTEAELGTGDILCVQNVLPADELAQLPDPRTATITHYFEDYRNRMTVIFKHKNKEKETPLPDLELVLSKRMNYDAVVAKLGPKVNWDSAKIQLFSQQGSIAKLAIKRSSTLTLQEMTNVGYYVPPGSTPTTLHYELLDIPLSELETKRFVKIVFIDRQQHESDPIDFLVSKTGVVDELLKAVGEKVQLSQSGSGKLRLFEVHNFRPYKTFGSSDYISIIGESANLYAEEIPVEELEATETDVVVNVCHFTKDTSRGHGVPFRFVVKQGEIFSAAKARMITSLGIAEKDAVKMKFFWVPSMQRPKPIEDDDILSDVIIGMGNLDYLGIDHVDRSGKSSKGGAGGAIKIFN